MRMGKLRLGIILGAHLKLKSGSQLFLPAYFESDLLNLSIVSVAFGIFEGIIVNFERDVANLRSCEIDSIGGDFAVLKK